MRASLEERLLSKFKIDPVSECWNWLGSKYQNTGYGQISHKRKNLRTNRVSYEIHFGAIPDGMHVCHRCDNRACINPNHLFLGTNAENMADRNAKGRQARGLKIIRNRRSMAGTKNPRAKLSESDVLGIRGSLGIPIRKLAKIYGISPTQTARVQKGESWTRVQRSQS